MADPLCLAIDAMGGDFGPRVTVPATYDILRRQPQLSVVLLGDELQIQAQLPADYTDYADRVSFRACQQIVSMDEKPSQAVRNKRDSSMWQAVQMLAAGEADAVVSAGNTGALLAMSLLQLKTVAGIDRPAICTKVPTAAGYTYLLDMGANLDCSAEQLCQFAQMANLVAHAVDGLASPRVGLLNIGSEEVKGRPEIRAAAELIAADSNINYVGFIEGNTLFSGAADIVVCDGFSGNIALKTAEGVSKLYVEALKQSLKETLSGRIAGALARPSLRAMQKRLSPAIYNGASLLGLNGVVIKSHGGADQESFGYAVESAVKTAAQNLPALLQAI